MPQLEIITPAGSIIEKQDADRIHEQHLLHRSVHIFLIDKNGKIFLRQRPSSKKLYPGLWTSAVGAHILSGQTPDEAAKANLISYLGLEVELTFLGEKHVEDISENELASFYLAISDLVPSINPEQSMEQRFMNADEVSRLVAEKKVTPYIAIALDLFKKYRA